MWHQPRPMFHLALPRSESAVPNCILSVCSLDCHVLPLGCGHNVHVSRYPHLYVFCSFVLDRYQFAILLGSCRTIMRPGAMWFIKDPSDQNFHPIRDILERPSLVQLRKLSVSAIMYGLVVACGVGSIGGLMRFGRGIILPLRWKPRYAPINLCPLMKANLLSWAKANHYLMFLLTSYSSMFFCLTRSAFSGPGSSSARPQSRFGSIFVLSFVSRRTCSVAAIRTRNVK